MPTRQITRPPECVIKDDETHWTVLGVVVLEQRDSMKEWTHQEHTRCSRVSAGTEHTLKRREGKLALSLDPCITAIMQGKTPPFLTHILIHIKLALPCLNTVTDEDSPWFRLLFTCCLLVLPSVYTMPRQLACREQHHSLTKISPHTTNTHFSIYNHRVVAYRKLRCTSQLFEPEKTSPKLGIDLYVTTE